MSASGNRKTIGEKYSLDYYRRPWVTRAWKSRWNWGALFLSMVIVAILFAVQRDTAFQAGPVSSVHSTFSSDCSQCHDQKWNAATRLVTLSDSNHSVSDAACRECHNSADHAKSVSPAPVCAACHQEHRPDSQLTEIADGWCTSCHSDLSKEVSGEPNFVAAVRSFGDHPEFALLRSDVNSRREGLLTVASHIDGKWLDHGGLKFNHKVHLVPEGVPNADREKVKLACADCHTVENSGAYMRPILYEQHCAECHPLALGGILAAVGTLPHASPEEVRGVLRERLANLFAEKNLKQKEETERLPLLPVPVGIDDNDARQVDAALAKADLAVFGPAAKGGCRYCHDVEEEGNSWKVPQNQRAVASQMVENPVMVPDRWLPHGGFHHEKHRSVACAECHNVAESTETSDILLPSLSVCQKCHTDNSSGGEAVRADCVLCHKYHGKDGQFLGVPLEKLITTLGH